MHYKLLGNSGLRVSEVGLGTNTFGTEWAIGTDKDNARAIFEAYAEAGGNFIDTANTYALGSSEKFIGEFMAADREKFVLATKFSMTTGTHPNAGGNQRKNMIASLHASLKRLKVDYIDLYYLHAWDGVTPLEEVMRAFDDMVRAGKVLYVGISDTPAWVVARMLTMAEIRGWTRPAAIQIEHSLVARTPERELIPMAKALGLGVVSWYALGAGVLTGKYNDPAGQGRLASDSPYLNSRNLAIAAEVVNVARDIGRPPSQVAINWVRQQHAGSIPLIGSRSAEQTLENLGCLDFELAEDHLRRLDAVSQVDLGFPQNFLNRESMRDTLKRDFR